MNQPNPNESCELRNSAAVTPQAFTLLKSDVINDRSIAFAVRVQKEHSNDTDQWIRRAVQIAYSRVPTAEEQKFLSEYLTEMRAYHQMLRPRCQTMDSGRKHQGSRRRLPVALYNSNEFMYVYRPRFHDRHTRSTNRDIIMATVPRRDFLYGLGSSLGALALTDLQAAEVQSAGPLAPKKPMHEPKAKAVIMLFMEGGPSQTDTFDPKPELTKRHLTESTRTAGLANGKRFFVGSPFKSRKVGNAGIEMSEPWQHLADPEVADELCVYRGCQAESLNHPEALLHMNTGSRLGGDPGVGSWATYGLGSENQNLPGYVVMTELALPQAGPANWTNGFLPAY